MIMKSSIFTRNSMKKKPFSECAAVHGKHHFIFNYLEMESGRLINIVSSRRSRKLFYIYTTILFME